MGLVLGVAAVTLITLNTLPPSSGYVIRVGYEPIRTNCHAG